MANSTAARASPVNGGSGNDVLGGDELADVVSGGSGNDTLSGRAGDDVLRGDAGDDTLDGGSDNDRVEGNAGDDVAVYVAAENAGALDEYDGGAGVDTLRLVLTREEWLRPAVQNDIAAFLAFISGQANASGEATAGVFAFTAFELKAGKFERLEVTVDGVPLDPRDETVALADDASQTDEDGTAAGAVLANDAVPDLVRSIELVVQPVHGTLVFNADGTYVYTPGVHFNSMAAGETATETFQYKVTDADFDSTLAMVTVTITGTNDGPVVTNTTQELVGAVQEDGPLTASGQLSASDVDHDATQTWTVEGAATGSYGSIAVDANARWTYTLDNAAHQALAQGESHEEAFTIRVSDDQGAFVDQVVTVSVAGTNDAPVIAAGLVSGSVTEDSAIQATGRLVATDVDHGARQTWTAVGGTPSGSADFHFALDSFSVTRNGAAYFRDDFSDGVAPPIGPDGATVSYVGTAVNRLPEAGGRVAFDGANALPFVGVGTPDPIVGETMVLRTSIDPANLQAGLKSHMDFTVTGLFDLLLPDRPRETFGIRLNDRLVGGPGNPPDQLGDNSVDLRIVQATTGRLWAVLWQVDFVHDTITTLQAIAVQPPAGADQIRLNLSHAAAQSGMVHGSFDYVSGGSVVASQAFSATGHIFQGENWTRAEVLASAPALNDSVLGGTYGSLVVDQSGKWTYDLDGSRAATQALAEGEQAVDTFTVKVQDEFGAFDTRTLTVNVTGANDAPVLQTSAVVTRSLAEDAGVGAGQITAAGQGQFADVDLADTHSVGAALASARLSDGSALPAPLAAALPGALTVMLLDEATGDAQGGYRWDFALDSAATQFLAAGQDLVLTYDVQVSDNHGASATQQVTITVRGANDAPVIAMSPDGSPVGQPVSEGAPAGVQVADLDATDPDGDAVSYYFKATSGVHVQSDGNFNIHPTTGIVTTARSFDDASAGNALHFTAYAGDGSAETSTTYAVPVELAAAAAVDSKVVVAGWYGGASWYLTGVESHGFAITAVNGTGVTLKNASSGYYDFELSGWTSFEFVVWDGAQYSEPATVSLVADPVSLNDPETYLGTDGNDAFFLQNSATVHAGAGNDRLQTRADSLVYGEDGADWVWVTLRGGSIVDGGPGADTIELVQPFNAGVDTVILRKGEAGGDLIRNFGLGSAVLHLVGYDAGATLTNPGGGDTWQVSDSAGTESFRLVGVTSLSPADYLFM